MSQITRIALHPLGGGIPTGFGRFAFDETIDPVVVFTGVNGAGKTTRVKALLAALLGGAARNTDPRRPFIGSPLPGYTGVTVDTTAGGWTRDLSQGPTAKASKAADTTAAQLVGMPPVAWRLSDWSTAGPTERAATLSAIALAGGAIEAWDAARAQAEVRALLEESAHPTLDEAIRIHPTADTAETWIGCALTWAESEVTERGRTASTAHGTWKALQAAVRQPPAGADKDAVRSQVLQSERATLTDADATRARIEAEHERHRQAGKDLETARDQMRAEYRRLSTPTPAPVDRSAILADLRARLAAAEADLTAPIPAYDGQDVGALQAAVTAAEEALRVAKAAQATATKAADDAESVAQRAREASASRRDFATLAKSKAASTRTLVDTLASIHADGTCVNCDHPLAESFAAQLTAARVELEADDAAVKAAESAALTARTAVAAAERTSNGFAPANLAATRVTMAAESALTVARQRVTDSQRAPAAHEKRVRDGRTLAVATARRALTDEEARATRAATDHVAAEKARTDALAGCGARGKTNKAAIEAHASAILPPIPGPADPARLLAIDAELSEIRARDDARAVHRAAVAAVEEAGLAYSAALAEHQSVQALVSALRSALTKMAAASYGPIEAAARRLYDGSGLPAPYFAGLDDYGADVPGRGRVPFLGLSQAEGNVTAAALVCALAVVSGQPCRLVLLDGIEVMQADHRPLLLAALVRAVERGDVDNVIVTMSTSGRPEVADEQEAEISMPGVTIRRVPFVPLPEVDVEPEPLPPRPVPTQAPAPVVESGEVEIPF